MKFKQLTILLTVSLLGLTLSACGETDSESEGETREEARDEAVQTAEEFLSFLSEEEFEEAASFLSDNSISEWTSKDFEDLFVPTAEIYGGLSSIDLMEEEEDTYSSIFNFVYEGKFGARKALFYIGINKNNEVFNFRTNIDPELQFSENTHDVAEGFLEFAREGAFEEAADLVEDDMESDIAPADIASDWSRLEETYGEFADIHLYDEQTFSKDSSLIYAVTFGKQLVLFNIYVNEDNAITGYYSRSYDEEENYIYPEEAHQTAEDFLTFIAAEDYEEAADLLDDAEAEATPEDLERWRNNVEQEYGEWIRFELNHEKDYYGPSAGNYSFVYDVEFSEQPASIIVYVNRENEISGYRHTDMESEE